MINKLNFEQAKEIAWAKINGDYERHKHVINHRPNPPMLQIDSIIDVDWAIIFPYDSERVFIENDYSYAYCGNCPLLVDLIDGSCIVFSSRSLVEDFSTFSALKNYAAEKGRPWDKSLEDYLNDQGLYPNSEKITPRKFPHRLEQYKPAERKRGVFDFDKVENFKIRIRYAIQMDSIEQCKIILEREFSVKFEDKGRLYEGVYNADYQTVFLESALGLCFNYYKDEYEEKWFASEFKELNIVLMVNITTGKKEDRLETYRIVHEKLLKLGFVDALCMHFSDL